MALSSYVFVINSKYVVEPDNFNTPTHSRTHTDAHTQHTQSNDEKSSPLTPLPPIILPHSTCLTALMHILMQN